MNDIKSFHFSVKAINSQMKGQGINV